uniref:Oligosaccharide biosynthesis protein Alg14 like n=1 Tax=Candidatus Kentrum sp. UNK TaxID=2126344 RepID=A0A451A8I3_9GAMM|nr:MAG: Oligosaccharide biosynthesis protein Alg14 like [Candidatus Kentron sp. UNK]VFK70425.1 MAG: Oligosaccharide biosynthesis protein Alg14 like [Candidatus Kentron sp. UNK]
MCCKTILLVASNGGHWIQLNRLRSAFEGFRKIYISTSDEDRDMVADGRFFTVPEASRWNKLKMLCLALKMLFFILRFRPDVVVSTGAAPGYFALRFGKWIGARTIWLDSIANVNRLSLSGQMVRPYADLWLTQWPHLSTESGPHYRGGVL